MEDCVFCGIVGKKIPTDIVFEDETAIAFADSNPSSPVHLLIVPKEHLGSIDQASAKQAELLGTLLLTAAQLGRSQTNGDYSLLLNAGNRVEVDHLHVHLNGTHKGGDDT